MYANEFLLNPPIVLTLQRLLWLDAEDYLYILSMASSNALHLNLSKSSLFIVGSSVFLFRVHSFNVNINAIPYSFSIRILGVHLNSSWSFESHVIAKCRIVYTLDFASFIPFAIFFLLRRNSMSPTCWLSHCLPM